MFLFFVRVPVEQGMSETRCWLPVPGAGAGAVSWLRAWWREVAGAGAGVPVLVL